MPPVTVAVAVPLLPPLQLTLSESKFKISGEDIVTVIVSLSLQPFPSVTVTS